MPDQIDKIFESSALALEYLGCRVLAFSGSSALWVRTRIEVKDSNLDAARELGTAFMQGLVNRDGELWLGPLSLDVGSIRFAEVFIPLKESSEAPYRDNTNGDRLVYDALGEERTLFHDSYRDNTNGDRLVYDALGEERTLFHDSYRENQDIVEHVPLEPNYHSREELRYRADAAWSEWGPWSECSPCAPQYDQVSPSG